MEQGDESTVRVKDRRRFDAEGNPRQDAEPGAPAAVTSQAPATPAETEPPVEAAAPSPLERENQRLWEELESTRKRMNDLAW
ncbi:MAG: hypothetical protein FJ086_16820, partial [Deltaproteobacteria bacterium]|nr:hypothetical protein [Deltaproteobacteria bacterium]